MQTIPLEEYRKRIRLQGAREEGIEKGREESTTSRPAGAQFAL